MTGLSSEAKGLGKETPESRQAMHLRHDQQSTCFIGLSLNIHTGNLSPGSFDSLTGHQVTSRPARKKPPIVPRLVLSIAWAEGKTFTSQATERAPEMPLNLLLGCWQTWPTFPALLKIILKTLSSKLWYSTNFSRTSKSHFHRNQGTLRSHISQLLS